MFSILIRIVVTSVYICAKTHQIRHLKWVYFIAWKLYVHKVDKKWEGNDKYKTQDNRYLKGVGKQETPR